MSPRCPGCPVDPALSCAALARPHPRYCALVAADPATWGQIVARTSAEDAAGPRPAPTLAPARPPYDGRLHAERLRLARACDFRGQVIGCACNSPLRYCMLGAGTWPGRPHEVTDAECQACPSRRVVL